MTMVAEARPRAAFADAEIPVMFSSGGTGFTASGVAEVLDAQPARRLVAAAAGFFAAGPAGPNRLVGALPFDPEADGYLFQPAKLGTAPARSAQAHAAFPARVWGLNITAQPDPAAYAAAVRAALAMIRAGTLEKVVLSRSLRVEAARPFDIPSILARLSVDPGVTVFSMPLPNRVLVGATPELLVSKGGAGVLSHPLAGSARRLPDACEDRDAAERLKASDKDRREHAMVVEAILDALAPYCRNLAAPPAPELVSTSTLWHLATPIRGTLRDPSVSSLELACALHPTPAVCGLPRRAAAEAIRAIEPFDRGFYSGAVGWCDGNGDGEWHVTIRCAEIAGSTARLYAGAGIVAGSDPDEEVAETATKFMALLSALGVAVPDSGF
ncbi:isochorismate synthase [Terrihabitans rhizophilus]|uniref:isochorismate synthase n=1 Tax=Terrihabitans rhizophilus TaxID=3092662 RepID=A0ABU4RLJ7_9HYPH|nr:isochorismate synthase [Terrihabitans sp. PJ23]MDX6805093.1 isochorismate synthase [Terrihabitans sp. PJ23]